MGIHKNVEMDNLSKDSCDALKAGMSYGKYMAMKAPTKATTPPPAPAPTGYYHVCHYCGKEFYVPDKRHKKFCSDRCRELSYYAPKVKTANRNCPICGKEFVTTKKQQKYCGEFCAKVGKSQNMKKPDYSKGRKEWR